MKFNKVSLIGIFFLLVITQAKSREEEDDADIDYNGFLADLFNTTRDNISNVDKSFEFIDISQSDVTFICYLPNNQTVNITAQNFTEVLNVQNATNFIIHGWNSNGLEPWVAEMSSRFHENTNSSNVIAVDWSIWANKNYFYAAGAVKSVGNIVADFIQVLYNQDQTVLGRIHVVGHSLGAHAAGFTGKIVTSSTNQSLDRITGLDAAGPLFEIPFLRPANSRLASTDANFVDLIHTDQGLLGVTGSYGKCDFFVNGGGPIQPGCKGVGDIFKQVTCSHGASHEYFTASMYETPLFEAKSCPGDTIFMLGLCNRNNETLMGEFVNREATGDYYSNVPISFQGNTFV